MSKDEIRKLLGGYSTNTLSAEEQRLLFEAAMEDQELFDALADEESLRELLSDPAARRELHQALEPEQPLWGRAVAWLRKPSSLVLAGGLATAVIVTVAVNSITRPPEYRQAARMETTAPEQAPAPPAASGSQRAGGGAPQEMAASRRKDSAALADKGGVAYRAPAKDARAETEAARPTESTERDETAVLLPEVRKAEERQPANEPAALPAAAPPLPPPSVRVAAPKLASARENVTGAQQAQALGKLRVAVLNVNSLQGAKQQPDAALTKDLASRLNQAPTQYAIVDQKEVERVLAEKNLTGQPLDSQTAASVGRSLGADAVIVGNATQQAQPGRMVPGVVGGLRQQQQMSRAKVEAKSEQQQAITAQVIDTRNAANQFTASADNIDRVATQLAQFKVDGAVTQVAGTVLTINLGAPAGVKAGDRFQVLRQDLVLGQLSINSVSASTAIGVFVGPVTPQAGDQVRRILD